MKLINKLPSKKFNPDRAVLPDCTKAPEKTDAPAAFVGEPAEKPAKKAPADTPASKSKSDVAPRPTFKFTRACRSNTIKTALITAAAELNETQSFFKVGVFDKSSPSNAAGFLFDVELVPTGKLSASWNLGDIMLEAKNYINDVLLLFSSCVDINQHVDMHKLTCSWSVMGF